MPSKDQLRKVAIYCDKYSNSEDRGELSLRSDIGEKQESCTNCTHFTREHRCELNLINKTLSSMAMELDLKS